ncbi:hypothetical protein M5E88_18345 [Akkermansia muciniphila]|nr:hypothetical protein M5E88_18345 [Akkermansia muciniphila]
MADDCNHHFRMFLTAFSVVQLFNGKKYAHENETVELDHTRLMDLGSSI